MSEQLFERDTNLRSATTGTSSSTAPPEHPQRVENPFECQAYVLSHPEEPPEARRARDSTRNGSLPPSSTTVTVELSEPQRSADERTPTAIEAQAPEDRKSRTRRLRELLTARSSRRPSSSGSRCSVSPSTARVLRVLTVVWAAGTIWYSGYLIGGLNVSAAREEAFNEGLHHGAQPIVTTISKISSVPTSTPPSI